MIPKEEIKSKSIELGIPLVHIEKDYVMGWLLYGIYNNIILKDKLVLKGGNCLRKVYFSDTRFSDDLDFTMIRTITSEQFKQELRKICADLSSTKNIPFKIEEIIVENKNCLEQGSVVFEGKVYFNGFAGDESITLKIKFDISSYEKIALPLQINNLIHNYSDSIDCKIQVLCYSLEEILAEKLRSIIQRTRARDLFDIVKIVLSEKIPINKINIVKTGLSKIIFT